MDRLLGSIDARIGDRPLPAFDSACAEALLAFLLLHRDAPLPSSHIPPVLLWLRGEDRSLTSTPRARCGIGAGFGDAVAIYRSP